MRKNWRQFVEVLLLLVCVGGLSFLTGVAVGNNKSPFLTEADKSGASARAASLARMLRLAAYINQRERWEAKGEAAPFWGLFAVSYDYGAGDQGLRREPFESTLGISEDGLDTAGYSKIEPAQRKGHLLRVDYYLFDSATGLGVLANGIIFDGVFDAEQLAENLPRQSL